MQFLRNVVLRDFARIVLLAGLLCLAGIFALAPAHACTGIRVQAQDGSVIFARTLEFGTPTDSDILFVPRGQAWTSSTPDNKPGAAWQNRYAFMGPNGFGVPRLLEGINEQGLYVGAFWFPGEAVYQPVPADGAAKSLSAMDVTTWMLGTCASLDDVKAGLGKLLIAGVNLPSMGMVPVAHWYVMDAKGNALAIEPLAQGVVITDNPVGVFTNAPDFAWQLTNLRNYVNLSRDNATSRELGSLKLNQTGQGSGMLGLPGDYTPPSRFVRAAFLGNSVEEPANADAAVTLGWNLINNFSIPVGAAREMGPDGKPGYDYTQWTTVWDLSVHQVSFRTYDNQDIRTARLDGLPLDGTEILRIPMSKVQPDYQDVTAQAAALK